MSNEMDIYVETFLEFVETPENTKEDETQQISKFVEKSATAATPKSASSSEVIAELEETFDDILTKIKDTFDEDYEESETEEDEPAETELTEIPEMSCDVDKRENPTGENILAMIMDDNPVMEVLGMGRQQ